MTGFLSGAGKEMGASTPSDTPVSLRLAPKHLGRSTHHLHPVSVRLHAGVLRAS